MISPGIIGCDPGMDGALVLIIDGQFASALAMPTITLEETKKTKLTFDKNSGLPTERKTAGKRVLDLDTLCRFMRDWKDMAFPIRLYIEQVGAMPQQGVTSSFNFGFSTGEVHGAARMAKFDIHRVSPQRWKTAMSVTADKNTSIAAAIKMEPEWANLLKKDGVAEAYLIGMWGWRAWQKETK